MKHNRTILIGDFNHNPYESFMISPLLLNSMPNKKLVQSIKTRATDWKRRTIFYNPMWNFLGDYNSNSTLSVYNGSHFFETKNHKFIEHIHWNLFDQVLVSEPISDCLNPSNIAILSQYTDIALNKNYLFADDSFYISNKNYFNPNFSDHLPLTFIIDTSKLL